MIAAHMPTLSRQEPPAQEPPARPATRRLAGPAGPLIGIALLAWSLRGIELGALQSALRDVRWPLLLPLVASYVAVFWCKAWRLSYAVRPLKRVRSRELLAAVFASNLGNLVLPAYAGEVTRAFVLGRWLRIPVSSLVSAAVIERLLDFVVLLALLAWLLLATRVAPPEIAGGARLIGVATAALIGAIAVVILMRASIEAFADRIAARRRPALLARLAGAVAPALHVLRTVAEPRLLAGLITSSLAHWALLGACTGFALAALGIDAGWRGAASVLALVTAAMTLPSSPGWVGAVQIGFVLGLRPYGIAESEAFAASIVFHACVYFTALIAGIVGLHRMGLGWSDVAGARLTSPQSSRAG